MKKVMLLSVSILVFINLNTTAQNLQWQAKYNRGSNDAITAMAADAGGNVYVTGYVTNIASGADYVTIKYNTSGVKQWVVTYNSSQNGNDFANAICIDKYGNISVTGKSDNDAVTIKYDNNGHQLWKAHYDGGVHHKDAGKAIKTDNDGNVYVTGYTDQFTGGKADINYLTVKYNSSGAQLWASVYAGPASFPNNRGDSANAIDLDAAGNVYVTGMSNGLITGGPLDIHEDYLTVKYSSAGKELWTARYNGPGKRFDEAYTLETNKKGEVFITGVSVGAGTSGYDIATIKYNTNGKTQWVQRHNGTAKEASVDAGYALAIDDSNNVYVTGTDESSYYNEDIYTVKYNSAGVQQWEARYDDKIGDTDIGYAITLDNTNNVYVTGYSRSERTAEDIITIKYNKSGVQQWLDKFKDSNIFGQDISKAIAADSLNNIYIAGYTTNINGNTDYTVLKYSSKNAIAENKTELNTDNAGAVLLYQNTPNPFNNETNISFKLQNKTNEFSNVKLWIEDAAGKPLNILIDKQLNNGVYNVNWNAQHFLPGIYYCKLVCNNTIQVRKMVVIK